MAENVKVIVRCRPMNSKELELNSKPVVKMKDCMVEIFDPNEGPAFPKQFTFDSVYDHNSNTENIYNDICYPLVESVLEGYNSTIFVYGQTGCGKSFSMEGNKSSKPPEKGIISRTFEHIFEAISVAKETKYLAIVSYLEIYNEQIRDLLVGEKGTSNSGNSNNLPLKDTQNEGLSVQGLTTHQVHNINECEELLLLGSKNRMIGATLMNQSSSRSHSIFTISIEQINHANDSETIRKGKLNLVDLAGSERQAKTGATGDRLKEATKINLSLSALGNVISALVDGKAKHIPYRDSKLTRLLQDSLGGNTRTLMIACVSPASRNYVETLSTLRYANRAKNISNKPKVNEDPKDAILRQYQEEIERLKDMLNKRQSTPLKIEDVDEESVEMNVDIDTEILHHSRNNNLKSKDHKLDQKRDFLIAQYETEMEKLKHLHEDEKNQKENIMKQVEAIREEYKNNIEKLNGEMKLQQEMNQPKGPEPVNKEEILSRIDMLKAAMIGGEKANDKELSERRRKKQLASERRLSAIAHVLAKMDLNEDREILQNQYKDISHELNLKTDALRRFRHKVKSLEKEIQDIQGEFETERQDYLETIRKQDMHGKLMQQISEKMATSLKKECNYRDVDAIKEQASWSDDTQKYKIPELIYKRTKFPPAGHQNRVSSSNSENSSAPTSPPDHSMTNGNGSGNSGNSNGGNNGFERFDKLNSDDIVGSYFKPKRAAELLNQTVRQSMDTNQIFNTWRGKLLDVPVTDFANTRRQQQPQHVPQTHSELSPWQRSPRKQTNGHFLADSNLRRPLRLEALPTIEKGRHS